MAVAWYTVDDVVGSIVRLSISRDGGRTFDDPITVDDDRPLGRVDVAILACDTVLVCWYGRTTDGSRLLLRAISSSRREAPPIVVAEIDPSRASGFPTMANHADGAVLAWTEVGDDSTRVRTAVIEVR